MKQPGRANRALRHRLFASLATPAAVALALAACDGANGRPDSPGDQRSNSSIPEFDGAAALELVKRQVGFGPRVPDSPGHADMAAWLERYLTERADTLIVQRFEHVTQPGDTLPLRNFFARFQSSATPSLLLVAHWDTRPISDRSSSAQHLEQPVPGANDGGSGTAVLLQLAETFQRHPPPRAVDLLLVDGEDYGDFGVGEDVLLGSRYFAANQPDHFDPEYGIVLDMVGDRDPNFYIEEYSNRFAPGVVDRVWGLAHRLGFGDVFHRELVRPIDDDHIPLNRAGIPTIDIIDIDYPYWHTPDDLPEHVSSSSLQVVGTVMTHLVYRPSN